MTAHGMDSMGGGSQRRVSDHGNSVLLALPHSEFDITPDLRYFKAINSTGSSTFIPSITPYIPRRGIHEKEVPADSVIETCSSLCIQLRIFFINPTMPNTALFHDFLVPASLYKALIDYPPRQTSQPPPPHSLRFQAREEILVPEAIAAAPPSNCIVPAAINNAGKGVGHDAITIHLRVNTDVGMLDFSSRILQPISPPKMIPLHAEAHAVAFSDGSKPMEGFLRYSKGDPLWILKEPVEGCRRTKRSRLSLSPFAVKMANLRTGEIGHMLTTEVKLYPHQKLDARGVETLMSTIGYIARRCITKE